MNFTSYIKLRDKAYKLVKETSGDEMRWHSPIENQPYWTHMMNVHNFLVSKGEKDYATLIASILHDIIEDSAITKEYIEHSFSKRIADIVSTISKEEDFNNRKYYKTILEHPEIGPAKIKVADRLDNIYTHLCHSDEKAVVQRYFKETRKYFPTLAKRVGWEKDLQVALAYYKKHLS